jgi:hypothetical protein
VRIQVVAEMTIEDRNEVSEGLSSYEPLEVGSAGMVVRPVQPGARHDRQKAAKERLVPGVHAHGDGGLFAVPAEAPFPDEDAQQNPELEIIHRASVGCYTVW